MTAATRRPTRLRPIHFVLTLLLAFAGVFAVSAPAQATVPGQIDGYLTDTTLAPGNIYLDGLVVELYDSSGFVGYTTTVGGGYFSFTGLPDEVYDLYINGGPDNMDLEIAPFSFDDAVATDGELGEINLENAVLLTGTVRDPAGVPIENVAVIVEGQPSGTTYFPDGPTTSAGAYSVRVPGGEEYSLLAIDFGVAPSYNQRYWDQIYTHLATTCGCGSQPVTEVTVALNDADHTGLDFELHPLSHVQFDMLASDLMFGDPIGGLTIHLYKKVSGGYAPVEPGTTHTGAYDEGYVTSYGPGAGDYRLRFSYGSTYVPVDGWYDDYSSTGDGPNLGCYIDFNGLLDGDQFEMELVFDTSLTSGCGPEPAIVTGGGGSTGGTKKSTAAFFGTSATPTPTPTPSATPTSSPSPSSSPSSSPEPSETPTPEPTSDTGFPWWIILIIILILGIIITVIVIVRRR